MGDEPTDATIEEILRATSPERWEALWVATDAVLAEEEHVTWGGGETTMLDAEGRPLIEWPYAIYSDAVERMRTCLDEVGAIVPFNLSKWDRANSFLGEHAFDAASVADAVRMVTAILRAERFSEGTIDSKLRDGTMPAALRRIRRWHDEEVDEVAPLQAPGPDTNVEDL